MGLTARREKFCREVAAGKTATDAYRAAFTVQTMSDRTLWVKASHLYNLDNVRARIDELRAKVEEATVIDMAAIRAMVLADATQVLQADPSDLMTHRRLNCRHCHGTGHAFRWRDEAEFWEALAAVSAKQDEWDQTDEARRRGKRPQLPTDEGGYGFRRTAPPSLACPKCEGEGIADVHMADVRTLKGNARRLFNGVQVTKDGTKMLTRDQDAARLLLARAAGMLVDKVQHTGAVGLYPMQISDEQRDRILKMIDEDI